MITGDKREKIKNALYRTFQVIAGDILPELGGSISREEICETVLDANYLDSHGRLDKELLKEFQELPYNQRMKIAKEAFVYKTYSL